ncbi:MAG: hypothetical protein WEC37_03980, partial [Anaerolineales bacterium]
FVSDRSGEPQIWIINVDGTGEEQLTDLDGGACQPEWSPAGALLIFVSPCDKNQDSYPNSAIYLLDLVARTATQLTSGSGDFDPAWSPDGGTIAFTTLRRNNRPTLYLYLWTEQTEQFFSLGPAYIYQPEWSPAGDEVVYVTTAIGPELLFTSSMQERELVQFLRAETADSKSISAPEWSRDGLTIYYTITPQSGGFGQLYSSLVSDIGLTKHLIISEGIPNREGSLSPDGGLLAFESWPDGNHDIWIVSLDGSGLTRLTMDGGNDFDAAWRP